MAEDRPVRGTRKPVSESAQSDAPTIVYRTANLYEADMVAGELEAAGVPFFRSQENAGNQRWAMPVLPSPEPGTRWLIYSVGEGIDRARAIVSELPVTPMGEDDVWGAVAGPRRTIYRVGMWLILGLTALALTYSALIGFRL